MGDGARGVLEVRCHEAPFALEHGQVVGRLVYERMKRERAGGMVARQGLLIPQIVDLDPLAADRLLAQAEALEALGLALEPFGPGAVAVTQAPAALAGGAVDLATLMFNYHDLGHLGVDRAAMNAAVFRALKPGGVYVIADHAGRPGTGISESGTLHRVEEAFVRREVEAAGFKWVASGDFLRNPQDPRDRNVPEPPQPKDEFVLKFVKPTGS